jgi:hypothetical protein
MSFPPNRLRPLLYLIILSLSTAPWLLGQSPTPTPPVDTDGDGVPDHQDGWPEHKQLSSLRVLESQYVVVNVGNGTGYGLNNHGDVVGEAVNANGEREAVLWRLGQPPTFLGFLTEDQTLNRWSIAWGINDARQITGRSTYSWDPNVAGQYPDPPTYPVWDGYWSNHAFLWQAGLMTDLHDLSMGQPVNPNYPDPTNKVASEGRAINQNGIIAGQSDSDVATQSTGWAWHVVRDALRAAKFPGGAPIDLGIASPYGVSDAVAINDRGAIVGNGQGDQGAFFQLNGQTEVVAQTSGGYYASGLNNLDHVVGLSIASSSAIVWTPTSTLPENERVIDLGAISLEADFWNTNASAINDRDQIVGSGRFGTYGRNRAAALAERQVAPTK